MSAIEVEDLTKRFGTFVAVDHVRFNVEEGALWPPRAPTAPARPP